MFCLCNLWDPHKYEVMYEYACVPMFWSKSFSLQFSNTVFEEKREEKSIWFYILISHKWLSHTLTHTRARAHTHTHTHTHKHTHLHTHKNTHTCTHTHIQTHTCKHTHTYTHTLCRFISKKRERVKTSLCWLAHTHTLTHTDTHTPSHTHTNCSENITPPRFCRDVKKRKKKKHSKNADTPMSMTSIQV